MLGYDPDGQVLALRADASAGTTVVSDGRQVLRVEMQLVGPGAAAIWTSLQTMPGEEFVFESPTRSPL